MFYGIIFCYQGSKKKSKEPLPSTSTVVRRFLPHQSKNFYYYLVLYMLTLAIASIMM